MAEVKIFSVPFNLENTKENISIKANTEISQDQILNQAFKFHSEGNISEASKYYKYFINNGFKDHRVFSNYAIILKGLGKLQEAEELIRNAIQIKPDYDLAFVHLGGILKEYGKLEEAKTLYCQAIELNPFLYEAHSNLGNVLKDLGYLQEAETCMRKAIELKPDDAITHMNLGNMLREIGQLDEAESLTRKSITLSPNNAIAHSNLGSILKELGQLDEAVLSTRKAIELQPNYAMAHFNLGTILRDLAKFEDAEILTNKAIELNPNFAEAYSGLGSIYRDLGKLNDAYIAMRKAININPNFVDAHLNLATILTDLGKLDELIHLSKSTLAMKLMNIGDRSIAEIQISIAYLLKGKISQSRTHVNRCHQLIKQGGLNLIKNKINRNHTSNFAHFISRLCSKLNNPSQSLSNKKIPHIGESHCLSFAYKSLNLESESKYIQPILITGAKAWHFANNKNNLWKDSLNQQINQNTYSDQIFISFGEIDCRKEEGILHYSITKGKDFSGVCERTIKGYLDYMEILLSKNYSKRYYFGVPAPLIKKELLDELDIIRIDIIKKYNSFLKKEVLIRGSYFLDVYSLTSRNDGQNNNLYMCDNTHLSPECLSLLFQKYLYQP
ncbi:tetratricopeptide repeat protein [Prochlorococcus marinus]|uniref:tetratricopeptide repeat protein n=1 Tax=Prochlorococcus marinus TaxID=1219 RepID=UPI0022B4AB4D|nr:tetratricopeptide repeat protein [Prochlorococcus marinus]